MAHIREAIHAMALLLEYPRGDMRPLAEEVVGLFADGPPAAHEKLKLFAKGISALDTEAQEELYTRTFDINPQCCLEVGWQIYGESYDRGNFLVKLNAALREQGIEPTTELADHLPQMLRLFARVDPGRMRDLAIGFLEPGMSKMISGFGESPSPYLHLIRAANIVVVEIASGIQAEECHV